MKGRRMALKTCNLCKRAYKDEEDFLKNTSRWRVCSAGMLWFNCECDSTLVIPKGKFDWYSPDKILSPNAGKIFNKLGLMNMEIPMMPAAAMEAQSLLQDPSTSMNKISYSIRKMPHLAIEIIKIADNMKVGRSKIETLEHACVYVGRKNVAEIINLACIKSFEFNTTFFEKDKFWHESFLTGLIAEQLAVKFLRKDQRDLAYLAGSLANIGKILLAILLPEKTDSIYKHVSMPKEVNTWTNAERELGVVNHMILGEIACRMWGLPDFIVESVVSHHGLEQEEQVKYGSITEIVALSNQIMHWVSLNPSRIEKDLMDSISLKLGIDGPKLEQFCEDAMPLAVQASELVSVAA